MNLGRPFKAGYLQYEIPFDNNSRRALKLAMEKLVMKHPTQTLFKIIISVIISCSIPLTVDAQNAATVLAGSELTRIVPTAFYFQGLSASTQMRNSAAARFGAKRYVIAAIVDTAGYAADVRDKYQGFLITDSPVRIGGFELGVGAYGFGFVGDGKFLVMDLSGKELFSTLAENDKNMKRPRPLMMSKGGSGVRLYSGRSYVTIAAN
ncbi:MAG: hypothetical protein JWM21_3232 [Acidobacteria bacterium]|nr:hypothetical protein [Acidobacteriota bacterium]